MRAIKETQDTESYQSEKSYPGRESGESSGSSETLQHFE